MSTTGIRLTVRDYRERPDDSPRVELLDGAFVVTPSPTERHQAVVGNLYFLLRSFLQEHPRTGKLYVAPFDVYLSEHDVPQPDLLVVLSARTDRIREDGVHGPPDLVIEVLSPSMKAQDLTLKRKIYLRSGVPEYWIVDPKPETVAVHRLQERRSPTVFRTGERVAGQVLPQFRPAVTKIFAP